MALRILCDVDGVLADCVGHICKSLRTGRTHADFKFWDLAKCLSHDELILAHAHMRTPGWWKRIPWIEGAQAALADIRDSHHVRIVTAPFSGAAYFHVDRLDWLARAGIDPEHVIFKAGHEKQFERGDILIEDQYATIEQWLARNPDGRAILMDAPWNREEMGRNEWKPSRMRIIANVDELPGAVAEMARQMITVCSIEQEGGIHGRA
jgi:5'(3')-deoxyribonucleotidase